MNKALAITKLVEEAKYLENEKVKNLSGSISDPAAFADNIPALEALHHGLFSFLAFHPGVDRAVAEYIEKGSIASDSGANILVFFLSAVEMRFPRDITAEHLNLGVALDMTIHPSYQFARSLFSEGVAPQLPGLILFDHVSQVVEAVYVPIDGCDTVDKVARFCRSVFVLADNVVRDRKPGKEISVDLLCRRLGAKNIGYSRNRAKSLGEWVITLYNFAKNHGGTIASVVLKVVKLG